MVFKWITKRGSEKIAALTQGVAKFHLKVGCKIASCQLIFTTPQRDEIFIFCLGPSHIQECPNAIPVPRTFLHSQKLSLNPNPCCFFFSHLFALSPQFKRLRKATVKVVIAQNKYHREIGTQV